MLTSFFNIQTISSAEVLKLYKLFNFSTNLNISVLIIFDLDLFIIEFNILALFSSITQSNLLFSQHLIKLAAISYFLEIHFH
jgi:hypothetical protein